VWIDLAKAKRRLEGKKSYLKRDGEWKGGEGKVYKTIPIQPNINRPFQNAFL
jgi:hypothetical protein